MYHWLTCQCAISKGTATSYELIQRAKYLITRGTSEHNIRNLEMYNWCAVARLVPNKDNVFWYDEIGDEGQKRGRLNSRFGLLPCINWLACGNKDDPDNSHFA